MQSATIKAADLADLATNRSDFLQQIRRAAAFSAINASPAERPPA
jgi:hypothetical protein